MPPYFIVVVVSVGGSSSSPRRRATPNQARHCVSRRLGKPGYPRRRLNESEIRRVTVTVSGYLAFPGGRGGLEVGSGKGGGGHPLARVLHSPTFQLTVSTFCGIMGDFSNQERLRLS